MNRLILISFAAAIVTFLQGAHAPMAPVAENGAADYVYTVLKAGPKGAEYTAEERAKIQEAHLANIKKLGEEGALLIAGPFGKPAPEATARGIFIFDVPTIEAAEKFAATDPAVKAGVLSMESVPLRAPASLRRMGALEKALQAELKAASAPSTRPAMPPGIGPYVLGMAADADKAEKALAPLLADGRAVFFGRFGGKKQGAGLFILQAADVKAADAVLEPCRQAMGECTLHPWYSSKSVGRLAAKAEPGK